MKCYSAIEKYRILDPILKAEVTMVEVSAHSGIPVRTLRYWKKRFLEHGLSGLQRKRRSDQGQHWCISKELQQLTLALALHKPVLTVAAIHQKIKILMNGNLLSRQCIVPFTRL